MVELGVGTGRIAVPIAADGIQVIGVDSSQGMLEVAARAGRARRGRDRIDLRHGDLRDPPVEGTVPARDLSRSARCCTWRPTTTAARRSRAVRRLLEPGGRFVFDVFAPGAEDIAETHGRWLEREPGIFERADWDEATRTLILRVRGDAASRPSCRSRGCRSASGASCSRSEGFVVEALYGWFDRTPWAGDEDSIWVCRRSS